jgi:hypothetical protein
MCHRGSLKSYAWFLINKSQIDVSSHSLFRCYTTVILDNTSTIRSQLIGLSIKWNEGQSSPCETGNINTIVVRDTIGI